METELQALRRIVLGLSASGNMKEAIEAATSLAAALKSELHCLLIEQEDLINYAGLPFARAVGPGGLVSTLTAQSMAAHFDRLFREAERDLTLLCSPANVSWQLQRPQGEYFRELATFLEPGDTVIVSEHEIKSMGRRALDAIRELLAVAAAVVLPSRRVKPEGPAIALGKGRSLAVAQAIAGAMKIPVQPVDGARAQFLRSPAAVIVATISEVETIGETAFFRALADSRAMAVILAGELKEPKQPPR